MRLKLSFTIGIIINLFLISTGSAALRNTAPGAYENWGQMINRLDILRSFKTKDFSRLVIANIDTTKVRYQLDGFAEDRKTNLLEQGKGTLIATIKSKPGHLEMADSKEGASPDQVLILKISILEIGVKPGSMWWYPLAWVAIEGELVTPQNNEVLLKFKTTRTSSVKGVAGGSVIKDLEEESKKLVVAAIDNDFKELGEDLNELIFSFK